ncbi:hypothetical protein D9613_010978 [Agrocybe pediades]|uniref:F-box domain-containing protein n=1 Tax=Agrocybe pediades TaxID=84607 RepID=A0A8H4QLL2_9AGAR|nr:hypothetical protein D9613_010978 [Agrocybe pediades]
MAFQDLPLEILPEILQHIVRPQHLASACLVNKKFHQFTVTRLYERVSIYSWHKEGKIKVIKLFDTLSKYPYLASLLRKLEIRDFPKALPDADGDIMKQVQDGLRNCTNLRACTWTRDGSLDSDILRVLHSCQNLEELELNGHNDGHYDPRLLLGFTHLRRISIIMPSAAVVSQLRPWLSLTGDTLRSLTLICKASTFVTDQILESLAPFLVNLEYLHLTGCVKVTHRGVWSILSSNTKGLLGLGLEGVSPKFHMATLASQCISSGALIRLRSITLTVNQQIPMKEWVTGVVELLSTSPLELFQIYSSGAFFESPVTDDLWNQLILNHGQRITRFSVHRMLISLEAIDNICSQCTNLEQLFIVVEPNSLDILADSLGKAKKLRTVHINYPTEARVDAFPVLRPERALSIINRCSPNITEFGCNTRVWQVERQITYLENGTLDVLRKLAPYGSPEVPEQFLVVRT